MSRAAEAAMAASYKALKEDFVSNLTGGSIGEINLVTAVAPVSVLLWSVLQSRQSFFTPYTPLALLIDFCLNVCAILLSTTLYSSQPLLLNLLLLGPALIIYLLPRSRSRKTTATSSQAIKKKSKLPPTTTRPRIASDANGTDKDASTSTAPTSSSSTPSALPKKPFLTTYRGTMLTITCLAILAVDFRLFPRRFAKVETWGTSLMDVGVGSFVFSAGVVGARAPLKEQLSSRGSETGLVKRLYSSARHSVPLLVLGMVRLWSVKGLDYAEHVSEYGVHWNFFFTLGFLPPFLAIFQSAFRYIPSYAGLALLLGSAYQVLLDSTSLKAYVLTAPRVDILSQNREGISSFFGYLAIFLAGQSTGMFLLPRGAGWQDRRSLILRLTAWSVAWIGLFALSSSYAYGLNLPVSRRLANLPYILWIAAFNTVQILAFLLVETLCFPATWRSGALSASAEEEVYRASTSRLLAAVNRNGLAVFLLANLGTGLVNLTVKTLHVGDVYAMGILLVYAAALTVLAVGLDVYDISIKM